MSEIINCANPNCTCEPVYAEVEDAGGKECCYRCRWDREANALRYWNAKRVKFAKAPSVVRPCKYGGHTVEHLVRLDPGKPETGYCEPQCRSLRAYDVKQARGKRRVAAELRGVEIGVDDLDREFLDLRAIDCEGDGCKRRVRYLDRAPDDSYAGIDRWYCEDHAKAHLLGEKRLRIAMKHGV